jgi:deferrochelatase/peroxidase EfeB
LTGLKSKSLYKGCFNLSREIIIRRAYAYSEEHARALLIRRIAKEKGLTGSGGLFKVFDGSKENFSIEIEEINKKAPPASQERP